MPLKNPQINIRIDPELKDWLDAKANESRLSRTWIINNLIREEIKREQKESS